MVCPNSGWNRTWYVDQHSPLHRLGRGHTCLYICSGRIGKRLSETPATSIGPGPGYTLFRRYPVQLQNYLTNGSPTLLGYIVQLGKSHNPGFGSGPDGKPAHTPQRGLMISLKDLNFLNMRLLGWPIPSLLFVALLFLSGSQNRWDYLLIGLLFFLS